MSVAHAGTKAAATGWAIPAAISLAMISGAGACDMADEPDPASLWPRRYEDFLKLTLEERAELLDRVKAAATAQRSADLAFIKANHGFVTEGPWKDIAPIEVGYLGIDDKGCRVPLPTIADEWRFSPLRGTFRPEDFSEEIQITSVPKDVPVVVRILLGPQLTGIIIGKPVGYVPVQSNGIIDGKEYYFRAKDDYWSVGIGGSLYSNPDWYHEGQLDGLSEADQTKPEQVYQLIAKAAELYRAGTPSMPFDGPIAAVARAIKAAKADLSLKGEVYEPASYSETDVSAPPLPPGEAATQNVEGGLFE